MTRRPLLILTATTVAVTLTAAAASSHRDSPPAAPAVSPAAAAASRLTGSAPSPADPGRPTPTPTGTVTWEPGPWGEVAIAGHRLLVPASPTDGPLRDRGDGWASDYTPTAVGAAIALLRGPWFVTAAPAALRPEVTAAVLTPAAAADPGPVNPAQGWAIPAELLTLFAGLDLRTLGAVATLTDEHQATVAVFQQRSTPTGAEVLRSTHRLVYGDRQWRIDADYADDPAQPVPADQLPTAFTITAPGAG